MACEPNVNRQQRISARNRAKRLCASTDATIIECPECRHKIPRPEARKHIELCTLTKGPSQAVVDALEALRKLGNDPSRIERSEIEDILQQTYKYLLKRARQKPKGEQYDVSAVVVTDGLPDGAPHGILVPVDVNPVDEDEDPIRGILRLSDTKSVAVFDSFDKWEVLCFSYLYINGEHLSAAASLEGVTSSDLDSMPELLFFLILVYEICCILPVERFPTLRTTTDFKHLSFLTKKPHILWISHDFFSVSCTFQPDLCAGTKGITRNQRFSHNVRLAIFCNYQRST